MFFLICYEKQKHCLALACPACMKTDSLATTDPQLYHYCPTFLYGTFKLCGLC